MMDLGDKLESKIDEGNDLLRKLEAFQAVQGIDKLSKKINKELQFLAKFRSQPSKLKIEHLQCSNLLHLSAIVRALLGCSSRPNHVLKAFNCGKNSKKVIVDIVCADQWIKVIARSPAALERLSSGDQAYGQRSLTDQAKEYIQAAANYKPCPNLVFVFHAGVPERAASKLTALGITIQGPVLANIFHEVSDEENNDEVGFIHKDTHDHSALNLDITAMIAYVSALCNGHANHKFNEEILASQASWERQMPVKPMLDKLFEGKELLACESAIEDFKSILETLGGPGEKERAEELVKRIKIVPDQFSDHVLALKPGGKIRPRSKVIFGTGDKLRVLTVSANSGFVRAAQSQGVQLAVFHHQSRALTESKMITI